MLLFRFSYVQTLNFDIHMPSNFAFLIFNLEN